MIASVFGIGGGMASSDSDKNLHSTPSIFDALGSRRPVRGDDDMMLCPRGREYILEKLQQHRHDGIS